MDDNEKLKQVDGILRFLVIDTQERIRVEKRAFGESMGEYRAALINAMMGRGLRVAQAQDSVKRAKGAIETHANLINDFKAREEYIAGLREEIKNDSELLGELHAALYLSGGFLSDQEPQA